MFLLFVPFSENCLIIQDELQSFEWSKAWATHQPFMGICKMILQGTLLLLLY